MKPVLALLAAGYLALPAIAQEREGMPAHPIPSIIVTGNAEVHAAPDEATVRLGVSKQASTAAAAQSAANEVAQGILAGVTGLGVRREQVQTSQLTLYPVYQQQKPGSDEEPRVVAYRAANTVNVRLTNLSLVGPVIDSGLKAGSNQVEGVFFSLKNDAASREQALRQAVREAREKAQSIAAALDVTLGPVFTVEEGGVSIRPPQPLGAVALMARRVDVATPVSPGEVSVSASVTVRYRIRVTR